MDAKGHGPEHMGDITSAMLGTLGGRREALQGIEFLIWRHHIPGKTVS